MIGVVGVVLALAAWSLARQQTGLSGEATVPVGPLASSACSARSLLEVPCVAWSFPRWVMKCRRHDGALERVWPSSVSMLSSQAFLLEERLEERLEESSFWTQSSELWRVESRVANRQVRPRQTDQGLQVLHQPLPGSAWAFSRGTFLS